MSDRDMAQVMDDAVAWMDKEGFDFEFAMAVAEDYRCLFCDSRRCRRSYDEHQEEWAAEDAARDARWASERINAAYR